MTAHVKRMIANAALAAGVFMALAAAANAQARNDDGEFCGPAEKLMQIANENFHEQVKWTGKNKLGYRFIIMQSADTWTMLMVNNKPSEDGTFEACVKASDGNTPGDHS